MIRALARLVAVIVVIGVIGAGALAYLLVAFDRTGPLTEETIVVIPPGTGLSAIADTLTEAGVVEDRWVFIAGVYLTGAARDLRAGEFAFDTATSPREAMNRLRSGDVVMHSVTLPEGWTVPQAVERLRQDDRLVGDIGEIPPEGSLLPETYGIVRGDSRAAVLERMAVAHTDTLAELWSDRAEGLPFDTPEEAVILASIVERETSLAAERTVIAGVFINRLRRGMPLQSDPTVIYALSDGWGAIDRPLTRRDWETESPYNTYAVNGLPPGPIANPGRASIEAVLNPADTEYLYFVADGTGGHAFARTLAEHNRNVARWRQVRDGASE